MLIWNSGILILYKPYLSKGSYNIVVFLTICISYANNCFTL